MLRLGLLVGLSLLALEASELEAKPPNVILLNLDDADTDLLSDRNLERFFPNFQRLRSEGMRFTNFHVTSPLCGPSRMSLLRGQYAHSTGFRVNLSGEAHGRGFQGGFKFAVEQGLLDEQLGVWMKRAGYRTMFVGKFLNNGFVSKVPPGWDDYCASKKSTYFGISQFHNLSDPRGKSESRPPLEYRVDSEVKSTLKMLDRHFRLGQDEPFFLYYAPFTPHLPGSGDSADMPEPLFASRWSSVRQPQRIDLNEEDVSDKPSFYQLIPSLTPASLVDADQQYRDRLRATLSVDRALGKIMRALERQDRLRNTYIFVTSDNGYLLGHHRIWAKKVPFDRSSQVPAWVWGPNVPANSECDQLLGQIDLAPTLVDLANGHTPEFVSGSSFLPLWFDPQSTVRPWRSSLIIENWSYKQAQGILIPTTYAALRLPQAVFTQWSNGESEYYDLERDPYQVRNRIAELSSSEREVLSTLMKLERDSEAEDVLLVENPQRKRVGLNFAMQGVAEASAGVQGMRATIYSLDRKRYWSGTQWQRAATWHRIHLSAAGQVMTDWDHEVTLRLPQPATEKIRVRISGRDAAGDVLPATHVVLELDGIRPELTLVAPAPDRRLAEGAIAMVAAARDNQQVRSVRFQLYDQERNRSWNGSSWESKQTWFAAAHESGEEWRAVAPCKPGKYRLRARAYDDSWNRTAFNEEVHFEVR